MYINIECPLCGGSIRQEIEDIEVEKGSYQEVEIVYCPYDHCNAPIEIAIDLSISLYHR